jgi:hypothetical protein
MSRRLLAAALILPRLTGGRVMPRRAALASLACALALVGCKQEKKPVPDRPLTPVVFEPVEGADAGARSPLPGASQAPTGGPAPGMGGERHAGDHASVRWKGSCYPARIVSVPRPGAYLITYDGYGHSWDETIGEGRFCGGGGAPAPRSPAESSRRAGESVSVRWKGSCYPARILRVTGPGAYLVTYDGYAHSWDETVGESRICK